MKKRWFLLIMLVLIGVAFLTNGALTDAKDSPKKPQQEVKDKITIDSKGYKKDRYGPLEFHHQKHQDEYINAEGNSIACQECHHIYENGKNVWKPGDIVQKCVDCHDPLKSDPKNKKNKKLQLAFHNNCKNCHKAVIKAGLKKEKDQCIEYRLEKLGKKYQKTSKNILS